MMLVKCLIGLNNNIMYTISMNFIKNRFLILLFVVFLLFLPILSFAVEVENIKNPLQTSNINTFIKSTLEGVIRIGVPLIALAIIYCGFLFVVARGNPEKIESAKSALLYTLIGSALLLGSWAIAQLISDTVLSL